MRASLRGMKHMPVMLILGSSFLSAAMAIVSFGYLHNFTLIANVACDPSSESCFIGDGENTPDTYKIIEMKASDAPKCNGWEGDCEPLSCDLSTAECIELQCPEGDEDCYSAL